MRQATQAEIDATLGEYSFILASPGSKITDDRDGAIYLAGGSGEW